MHVIGKHVQSSGLEQAWIDSNSLGPRTAEQVLSDKSYAKGMRIHKQTMQAMWRILVPKLFSFIRDRDQDLEKQIRENLASNDTDELITVLKSKHFRDALDAFVESNDNPNFQFWWIYIQMVETILLFTRAQREGCGSFTCMPLS